MNKTITKTIYEKRLKKKCMKKSEHFKVNIFYPENVHYNFGCPYIIAKVLHWQH